MRIKIAEDFSDTPGARYYKDGDNSGQEFYEKILEKAFKQCLEKAEKLEIDFDDCYGFASSFLSESFGRLSEDYGKEIVLKIIVLKSLQDPLIPSQVESIILNPMRNQL
jgi:hypothetical protein